MPKSKRDKNNRSSGMVGLSLNTNDEQPVELIEKRKARALRFPKKHFWLVGMIALLSLGAFGAGWQYLRADSKSGKLESASTKAVLSRLNPFAAPPSPTPQLSKEYLYAGSRLLAVEDATATAVPPADLAVWRPSNGTWYVLGGPGSAETYYGWGSSGDIPVQGDFDGDGKTDFCVFRPSTGVWFKVDSSTGAFSYPGFGQSGDLPVVADYDGDGRSDLALWRNSTHTFYVLKSSDSSSYYATWGATGDIPVPADYDGDGKADITVWRNSNQTFSTYRTTDMGTTTVTFGNSGDIPVSGDYDGDGKANYALKHNADWIIMNAALSSTSTTTWQNSTDIPVPNDYDGDGIVDIAVWRDSNGHWYISKSGSGGALRDAYWGTSGDIPVPAYYRR